MKLITSQTLASSQSNITIDSIPQDFRDLLLKVSARTASGTMVNIFVTANSTLGSYRYIIAAGSGSLGSGASGSNAGLVWGARGASTTANTFGNSELYISNYTSSIRKMGYSESSSENNGTEAGLSLTSNSWPVNTGLNSLVLVTDGGNFVAGTTVYLYGIGGAGDGYAPKATGGTISFINGYWVHTFTSSGTLATTSNINNVEYLVVAGGGGGGTNGIPWSNGGGGAGGYRSSVTGELSGGNSSPETKLSLTAATNYTITVGAGGSNAANGQNSSIGSLVVCAGGGQGGSGADPGFIPAGSGGSGGGAGGSGSVKSEVPGTATTGQGFAGSLGSGTDGQNSAGGGGGGAGQAGVRGTISSSNSVASAGKGGDGISSSITGSAVTRGGGGGGGRDNGSLFGAGGAGGGGNGGANGGGGSNGVANTGGGAGGHADFRYSYTSTGGSGIVILRYPA
jgi:hypothetical protein